MKSTFQRLQVACSLTLLVTSITLIRAQDATKPNQDSRAADIVSANHVVFEIERGLRQFEKGDYRSAEVLFANGIRTMDRITELESRSTTALTGNEIEKTFKGEPYERATANFYRGLCRFNMGDYSGALAAFRNSLAADAATRNKQQKYLEDFTISQFMAALCYARLGELDNAAATLRVAQANSPNPTNSFLNVRALGCNLVVVIAVGEGPFKVGPRSWHTGDSPERRIQLFVDDIPQVEPAEATDLLFQAKTQERGAADDARVTRQVVKAMIYIGTGVQMPEINDARSWHGLPLKFYIFADTVLPGNHKLSLKAFDEHGKELVHYQQTWFDIPVNAGGGPVMYLRSKLDAQNRDGFQMVQIKPEPPEENPQAISK